MTMIFDQDFLLHLEKVCETFYNSNSKQDCEEAHEILLKYFDQNLTTEKVSEFKTIFENSTSPRTVILAINALIKVFSTKWTLITVEFRRSLYEFLISALYTKANEHMNNSMGRIIVSSEIQLLCKIIKTHYSDLDFNTNIIQHFSNFFDNFPSWTTLVGTKFFDALVQEMQFDEKTTANSKFSRHIIDFKDHSLPKIIEAAFQILNNIQYPGQNQDPSTPLMGELKRTVLSLILGSLTYDFLGIKYKMDDDFHEEISPILLPNRPNRIEETINWNIFKSEEVVSTFFEIYHSSVLGCDVEVSLLALKIIACLLRIKIQFFKNEQGQLEYILFIIKGLGNLLKNKIGLDQEELLTEFTGVIHKTNRNLNLVNFLESPEYLEWLEEVYRFTESFLTAFPTRLTSIQNLIAFWAYFVPYVNRSDVCNSGALSKILTSVAGSYIDSKFKITKIFNDQEETQETGYSKHNLLINHTYLIEHVKFIGQLTSLNFIKFCQPLAQKMTTLIEGLKTNSSAEERIEIVWALYIFLDMVCESKPVKVQKENSQSIQEENPVTSDVNLELKGDIASEVFKLCLSIREAKNENNNNAEVVMLEEACLSFIDQFVKSYFSDRNNMNEDTIFLRIAANLGLGDKTEVITFFLHQILEVFASQNEQLSKKMIGVLERLTSKVTYHIGGNNQRLLRIGKLVFSDSIFSPLFKLHIENGYSALSGFGKERLRVYKVLSKILYMSIDLNGDYNSIPNFLTPFQERLKLINQELAGGSASDGLANAIMDLLYDFIGTLSFMESERKYTCIVQNIFQIGLLDTIIESLKLFINNSKFNLVVLKFISELVDGKGCRIQTKQNSDIGPRMFKFVSQVVLNLGLYISSNDENFSKLPSNEVYAKKYKPTFLIGKIATKLIQSKMVNFAIHEFKDSDCDKFYDMLFSLIMMIPVEDITSYIKKAVAIYEFLDVMSKNYISFFTKFSVIIFLKVLDIVHDGLQSLNNIARIGSMEFISNICGHLLNLNADKANQEWAITLKLYLEQSSEKLQMILRSSFVMILNGEISNYSYFSKTILALIIVENVYFINMIKDLSGFYGEEKSQYLSDCFLELTKVIGQRYSSQNKTAFQKHLQNFTEKVLSLK